MSLLLLRPRWVIPVTEGDPVLQGHAVVCTETLIEAVLPVAAAQTRYPNATIIDLPGHALLPGLINAHTHAAMTLLRGYADDLPLETWLNQHIWPAEARWIGPDFVRDGVRLALAELIAGGTTCFADMYFFPDVAAAVAVECGVRAAIGMIVIGFASAWAADIDEYFRKGLQLNEQYRADPLVTTVFAPHAPYSVDDAALGRISRLAGELELPVLMHVQETPLEVANSIRASGERPLQRLARLGLLTPQLLAVHMTDLEPQDIDLVAHHGVHVVHCPESNQKLASGICPVEALRRRGVNVALGTDGAASNNDLDLIGEMRSAALLAKISSRNPTALPASAALRMATINGAQALGLADRIGSIEPGKQADLIAVDLDRPATQPVFDPISQLIYAATRDQVTDVWIAGRRLLAGGVLQTIDRSQVLDNARHWQQRLRAASGHA
jgi:5-methylthioadenosine/S-adenosylhomocysteine deaminase